MRQDCLVMAKAAGRHGFHFGATLSLIELMAVLYEKVVKFDYDNPEWQDRDRVIISKGHGVPAYYSLLHQKGVISDDEIKTFKTDNTELYGHPSCNRRLGIEFSSGSLGQGLSLGVGVALALRKSENNDSRVFVILGDGECNEGSVWEAAMSATKYNLNNITVIVDCNGLQYDGETEKIMPWKSMSNTWKSFGWEVTEIDGHNIDECFCAMKKKTINPHVILAHTIKGKGISFMENNYVWHHGILTKDQESQGWEEVSACEC